MANMTELTIERVEPGPNRVAGGVRITATVPWSDMTRWTMDKMVERRVALPADDDVEDEVFVSGEMPINRDALLVVGAIPAVVAAVARLHLPTIYGVLNGYMLELEEQRERLAGRGRRNCHELAWLDAELETISVLLRELRFASLSADGPLTRTELVKEELLLGGAKVAEEDRRGRA